jgi:bifunctional DNase/RNase
MRRVDITGIGLEASTGAPIVVLREQDEPHRLLPIFIGGSEASAIAIAATGQRPPRPLVHDVMASLVAGLDGRVDQIEVDDVQDGTFFASIAVTGPSGSRRVGSRPSDALALAVRTGAPIYVSDAVLDEAGTLPELEETDASDEAAGALDEAAIDAELRSFRTFLDDVDPADFVDTTADEATDDGADGHDAH